MKDRRMSEVKCQMSKIRG